MRLWFNIILHSVLMYYEYQLYITNCTFNNYIITSDNIINNNYNNDNKYELFGVYNTNLN